jgi:hypothetical protein
MGLYLTDLPEERIAKYRHNAADARESAYNAQTIENSNAYMELAAAWEAMAVDLEHSELATRKRLRVEMGERNRTENAFERKKRTSRDTESFKGLSARHWA